MAVSNEMKTHLQGTVTLGVFLTIEAKDGDVIRVWNGTRNKIVGGQTFYAYPITPSQLQAGNGLKADNLEVTSIYSGLFTSATLRARKWQGARVTYEVLNYNDFSMGYAERRVMFLGKTIIGKHATRAEFNSLSSKLSEPNGLTMQRECDVTELGDARCGFNINGNTADGFKAKIAAHVIAPILNRQQFAFEFDDDIVPATPATTTAPDKLYERGKITFLSGPNAGAEGLILGNEGNALTLYLPVFYTPAVNDEIELIVGCNRLIRTCRQRFANGANHRGFPHLPGRTKVFKLPG